MAVDVYYAYEPETGEQGWQSAVISLQGAVPEEVGPGAIRKLRIGMNPQAQAFTYWVRNVNVYFAKE